MGTPPIPPPARGILARLSRAGEAVYSARRKVATGAAAVLAVTMGYHVVFGQNGLTAYRTKRHDARELTLQMKDLQRENDELKGHVTRLTIDPNAIEHEAREELHYTRPGEVIYTMPTDDKQPAPANK
jgi:cell division protein FtsB